MEQAGIAPSDADWFQHEKMSLKLKLEFVIVPNQLMLKVAYPR